MKTLHANSSKSSSYWFLVAMWVVTSALCLTVPETALALDFPTIPGVSEGDDIITIIIKTVAFIFLLILYIIFAGIFLVMAYVAITSLIKLIKERDNVGDLVGKLMASMVVMLLCFWFLQQAEDAINEMKNVNLTASLPRTLLVGAV